MSTLTIRITKDQDQKMLDRLLKQYGVTQASKALMAAGHDATKKLLKLEKENILQREEIRKLRQLLNNLVDNEQQVKNAKLELSEQIEHTIKQLAQK